MSARHDPKTFHPSQRWMFLAGSALLGGTLLAYLPALTGGFVWDDDSHLTQVAAIQSPAGLPRIWIDLAATPQYYPLVSTTFWIECRLWGLNPVGYHLVNVLLHGCAAILLWLLLRRLAVPGAWLAAALFAVHPVCVESVAWVTERKNVLSVVFYLLAILAYLRFCGLGRTAADEPRPGRWYVAAVLLFVCAMLSKTVTCTLPAAILLLVWWKKDRLGRKDAWPLVPMFALGIGFGLVTAWLERSYVGASGAEWSLSWAGRCLLAGRVPWFYLSKLLVPLDLAFIYPRWHIDPTAWWQYLCPLATVSAVALLWVMRTRWGKGPLVGVLLFLGTLAPAMGFFNVYMMRYSYVADHFQYHAAMAMFALAGAAMARAARPLGSVGKGSRTSADSGLLRSRWQPVGAGLLLALLAAGTWQQSGTYHDMESLWKHTLAVNPEALPAWDGLGALYLSRGDLTRAADCYTRSIRVRPDLPDQHLNLGNVFTEMKRYDDAIAQCAEALRINPHYAPAMTNLGILLSALGRHQEAIALLAKVVELQPSDAVARFNLGAAYRNRGNPPEAVRLFTEGLAIKEDPKARLQLAGILLQTGDVRGAASQCDRALQADPHSVAVLQMLGDIHMRQGRPAEAVVRLHQALSLQPNSLELLNNLAWILATSPNPAVRNGPEALELIRRAMRIAGPDNPQILDTRAAALAAVGQFEEAVDAVQRAIGPAEKAGQSTAVIELRRRQALYQARKPYYDASPTAQ